MNVKTIHTAAADQASVTSNRHQITENQNTYCLPRAVTSPVPETSAAATKQMEEKKKNRATLKMMFQKAPFNFAIAKLVNGKM